MENWCYFFSLISSLSPISIHFFFSSHFLSLTHTCLHFFSHLNFPLSFTTSIFLFFSHLKFNYHPRLTLSLFFFFFSSLFPSLSHPPLSPIFLLCFLKSQILSLYLTPTSYLLLLLLLLSSSS